MSRFQILLCIAVAAASGAFFRDASFRTASPAQAADVASQSAPIDIAVLDVSKVFKSSKSFNEKMNKLKKSLDDLAIEAKLVQEELIKAEIRLKATKENSDEHTKLQFELGEKNKEFQLKMESAQRSIAAEEAYIYAGLYERIQKETTKIAREKRIRLVLRFQADAIDKEKRDSVLQGVNRPVIYQDGLDITDAVTAAINAE